VDGPETFLDPPGQSDVLQLRMILGSTIARNAYGDISNGDKPVGQALLTNTANFRRPVLLKTSCDIQPTGASERRRYAYGLPHSVDAFSAPLPRGL
jgi:hypothetical protein